MGSLILAVPTEIAPEVFLGKQASAQLGGGKKLRTIVWGAADDEDRIVVVGNFSGTDEQTYTLPEGLWYDYFGQHPLLLPTVLVAPGELRIFTKQYHALPYIHMPYEDPTDIMEVHIDGQNNLPAKFMIDGQVYIFRNGAIYDTMGRKVR